MVTLKRSALGGLVWSVTQAMTLRVGTMVVFTILARMLTPVEFGTFAVVVAIFTIASQLIEQGITEAIIQASEVNVTTVNSVFTLNIVLALIVSVTLFSSTEAITSWTGSETVREALPVCCACLIVQSITLVPQALMRRAYKYKELTTINVVALFGSALLSISAAAWGAGFWALMAQQAAAISITTILVFRITDWKPKISFNLQSLSALTRFAGIRSLCNFVEMAHARVFELYIGGMGDAHALGIYSVGSRANQALMQVLSNSVQEISLNAFARLRSDQERRISAFLTAVETTSGAVFPVFCLLALTADQVVVLLFGDGWSESAGVFRWLSILSALQSLQFFNGTFLNAAGHTTAVAKLILFRATVILGGIFIMQPQALNSIARTYVTFYLLSTPLSFFLLKQIGGVSLRVMARHTRGFIASGLIATGLCIPAASVFHAESPAGLFLLKTLTFGAAYVGAVSLIARDRAIALLKNSKRLRFSATN